TAKIRAPGVAAIARAAGRSVAAEAPAGAPSSRIVASAPWATSGQSGAMRGSAGQGRTSRPPCSWTAARARGTRPPPRTSLAAREKEERGEATRERGLGRKSQRLRARRGEMRGPVEVEPLAQPRRARGGEEPRVGGGDHRFGLRAQLDHPALDQRVQRAQDLV